VKITTENLNCPRCNILWLMYAGNTIIPKNHGGRMILNCDNADIELFSKNLKEKSKKSVVRVFCQNQNFNGSPCGFIHPYVLNISSNEKSDKIKIKISKQS